MAIEAILEINCYRYSERIIDIIHLFDELGWEYYDNYKNIEYLSFEDDDNYNWKKSPLSEKELQDLIDNKQDSFEEVGINLYYKKSCEGITLLAKNTKKIMIGLSINRKTVTDDRESVTDVGWYINNIIIRFKERGCPIDYFKFEEYVG